MRERDRVILKSGRGRPLSYTCVLEQNTGNSGTGMRRSILAA